MKSYYMSVRITVKRANGKGTVPQDVADNLAIKMRQELQAALESTDITDDAGKFKVSGTLYPGLVQMPDQKNPKGD